MARRTLTLLAPLGVLAIGWLFIQDRDRGRSLSAESSAAPTERELTAAPDSLHEPVRVAKVRSEPSTRSEIPVHRDEGMEPKPAILLPETADSVLVFRALDETGRPLLGELSVSTKVRGRSDAWSHDESTSTDGAGRFEVRIDPAFVEGDRRELEISARERTLMARVDISRSLSPGRTDMGDLVLAPAPLVAEGRVIDAAGRPVVDASILASNSRSEDDEVELFFDSTETAGDGSFELFGYTNVASIEVSCLDNERLLAPRFEVPVGSRGIEIVAQESGGVAGQVLVDPEVPVEALRLILSPEKAAMIDAYDSSRRSSRKEVERDGRFQLEDLLPCFYTFSIATGRDVLIEISEIEVVPGEITRDARLQALELRGRLHVFTLDLVRPSRSFQLSGSVCFNASGTTTPMRRQYFSQSPVVLLTSLTAIDAIVRTRGCRIERVSDLAEHTEVHLRPALPVRLALPGNVALPAPPVFVSAMLEAEGQRPEERPRSYSEVEPTPPFDEHGEAVCQVCEPGRMKVRWFVERRHAGGMSRGPLDVPFERIVIVEDRQDEQRIELAITQQELAAALSRR